MRGCSDEGRSSFLPLRRGRSIRYLVGAGVRDTLPREITCRSSSERYYLEIGEVLLRSLGIWQGQRKTHRSTGQNFLLSARVIQE
jgi:hypothetical protein